MARLFRRSSSNELSGEKLEHGLVLGALVLLISGLLALALFLGDKDAAKEAAVGLAVFLAAGLVGGFAGFLFGLPRDAPDTQTGEKKLHFLFNSNLLKVSDFITTIIVGLSLTQLGNVIPAANHLANALRKPLGDSPQSGAIGVCLVIAGFTGSAILFYIWTAIRLREYLERSEVELRQYIGSEEAVQTAVNYIQGGSGQADVALALAPLRQNTLQQVKDRLEALPDQALGGDEAKGRLETTIAAIDEQRKHATSNPADVAQAP